MSCAAGLLVLSCDDQRRTSIALNVEFEQPLVATCFRDIVTADGDERATEAFPIPDDGAFRVGIFQTEAQERTVSIVARGYLGTSCDGPLIVNEVSAPIEVQFVDGEIVGAKVTLTRPGPVEDADRDGYRAASLGGPDCDDTRATVYPGAMELCSDGLDNGCDATPAIDCEDSACQDQACDDGNPCTLNESCHNGACTNGIVETCAVSPGPCMKAPGTCSPTLGGCTFEPRTGEPCEGGFCRADGQCVDSSMEAHCGNGIDDDNNGLTDCEDEDCAGQACDDGDPCTVGDTCTQGVCVASGPKICTQTADPCRAQMGACGGQGACGFPLLPVGTPCPAGECRSNGSCGASETAALCSNGFDDDGDGLIDCNDPSCIGSACDDGNACTVDTVCAANGTCGGGTTLSCDAPGTCQALPGTCDAATGCKYAPTPDVPCPGGLCTADGTCKSPFPFTPSNFDPNQFAPKNRFGPYDVACGAVIVFETSPGAVNQDWCGSPAPTGREVKQSDGSVAVVIALNGLRVASGTNLGFRGPHPVILAVYGDANIEGHLFAGSNRWIPGSGGDSAACGASAGGPGNSPTPSGGGGGGGFGTAGANGGSGAGNPNKGGAAGIVSSGAATLVPLRGGCPGGTGGTGARGGAGGGALQLSVSGALNVSGLVSSRGGGGEGGAANGNGGGGGGTGGAVLLEARSPTFGGSSIIAVNGGAGGEGGGQGAGEHGQDARIDVQAVAVGGNDEPTGGNGGNGAYPQSPSTAGAQGAQGAGGGGGGGGLGYIRINAANGCNLTAGASFRGVLTSSGTNCP